MKEIKRCPYCGKEILSIAKKCRYCGKWLPENENLSSSEKKWHFINDKKIIILGILVFLVIIVWSGLGVSQTDNNAQIKQNDPVINFGEQKQDDKSIVMPEKLERKPTVPKEIIDESNVSSDMQNSIDGLLALGERYENGVGVEVNLDLAFSYYYSAAEYGDPVALNKIGNMYANGKGCEQNMYKAAIFYKKPLKKAISMPNII